MKKLSIALIVIFVLPLFLLSGCGSQKEPSAQEIIQKTSDAVGAATSFNFRIDATGAPAYIGGGSAMSLNWAEGTVKKPDSAKATLNVAALSLVIEIQFISIGKDQYW